MRLSKPAKLKTDRSTQPDEELTSRVPPDHSGWTPHPSERRDFYHRIRVFPREIATWRREFVRHVSDHPERFPAARRLAEKLQSVIDDGMSYLREVARILAVLYGSPNLGNKPDPTDELVYIILARHTREGAYQPAFELLKRRFRRWDDLLNASPREVERLIYSGGLSKKKTTALFATLGQLRDAFG